jgi:hypothetical protein
MAADPATHADPMLSESEYANRVLPAREDPYEVAVTLLSALAIVLGLSALYFTPFKPGFLAIGLATFANAMAAHSTRLPRIAMIVAALGWLLGGILAVAYDEPVW